MLLSLALVLVVLSGCANKPDSPDSSNNTPTDSADVASVVLNKENFPRIDGSTANIPMALLMVQRLLGISEDEADEMLYFSTTPNAYRALINKETDLLLVYEADDTVKELISQSGVALEYHPIGRDALVFLMNDGNPVESLTTKQIQDIYQGNINTWKAVGGEDKEIIAYQRSQDSGSQALIVKLVMGSLPLVQAPVERYPGEMGGLIDALASYKNSKNALGYSVYYYAKNMYSQPELKFVAVDGVAPSNESIADGSYPFVNEFFAVVRKDEPAEGNTRKLLEWILSEQGKQAIADAGYVGL